jgi:hypothetical protein
LAQITLTGNAVEIFQKMLSGTWVGIGSGDGPDDARATMEMILDDAVVDNDELIGPTGYDGDDATPFDLRYDVDKAADLPNDLTEDDKGKAWWIGSTLYVWDGRKYRPAQPGPSGAVGPIPELTTDVSVIPVDERQGPNRAGADIDSHVIISGEELAFHLAAGPGPKGTPPPITEATNYDTESTPVKGEPLSYVSGGKWATSAAQLRQPHLYSIPQAAFINPGMDLSAAYTVLSWTIPEQDFDYVPWVTGHFRAFGIELDWDPLTISTEARLGDPLTGQIVAKGIQGRDSWNTVTPHFTDSEFTGTTISPAYAGSAVVLANTATKLNFTIRTDGLIGLYSFDPTHAGAAVLIVPH